MNSEGQLVYELLRDWVGGKRHEVALEAAQLAPSTLILLSQLLIEESGDTSELAKLRVLLINCKA